MRVVALEAFEGIESASITALLMRRALLVLFTFDHP
jgi:hypothetical protein